MTKKLLLADDSITIQKVIGIIFETEDYQLLMTDNGDKAFTMALEELPDLVIADISMPGKDGFELCQAIKSDPRLSNASVMLLPGTFDHFDEEQAQAVGADGWLTKPFESQALLVKVAQLLEAEPVRLAGDAPVVAAEEPAADFESPVVEGIEASVVTAPVVDEVVLGLDEIEGPGAAEEAIEESPDDIWDAVSFAEDDLQERADLSAEETPAFAAISFADVVGVETGAAEEPAKESSLELTDELTIEEPVAETVGFAVAADDSMDLEIEEQEPAVDAVTFILPEEDDEELLELEDEELLELEDVVAEVPSYKVVADSGVEELEPLDLMEETVVAEESAAAESVLSAGSFYADEPETADSEGFIIADSVAIEEEEHPLVEPLSEGSLGEDEDILDLADEDILNEEPLVDTGGAEGFEPVEFEEVLAEEECFTIEEEAPFTEESAPPLVEPETEAVTAGVAAGSDEDEQIADVAAVAPEEAMTSPDVEEDDGFYFDASEAEDVAAVEVAGEVDGMAVAAAASIAPEVGIERVEQQLRQLDEDDLKAVVAKVAGPIIEKLAAEMLERIAWEVVPDLAETMIQEEIRKIKNAEA